MSCRTICMQKLNTYIEKERGNAINIQVLYLGDAGPGYVSYERNCVILNSRFFDSEIENFGEDNLIDVLYHELGHLEYFKLNPITKEEFLKNETYRIESEYYAFNYSLDRLLCIAVNGDTLPLSASIGWLNGRIAKVRADNFEEEELSHCKALERISESKLFQYCKDYINLHVN
jgi:hypothetical protein